MDDEESVDEGYVSSHSYALSDYVIIHQCDPPCLECEFIKVSDKKALQLSLKEERERNDMYREKLTDLLKKYGQSVRQLEYQRIMIENLSRQLYEERTNNVNGRVSNEYAVIDPTYIENVNIEFQDPKVTVKF